MRADAMATSLQVLADAVRKPGGAQACALWMANQGIAHARAQSTSGALDAAKLAKAASVYARLRASLQDGIGSAGNAGSVGVGAVGASSAAAVSSVASHLDTDASAHGTAVDVDALTGSSLEAFARMQQLQHGARPTHNMTPAEAYAAAARATNPLQDDLDELDKQYFGVHAQR